MKLRVAAAMVVWCEVAAGRARTSWSYSACVPIQVQTTRPG